MERKSVLRKNNKGFSLVELIVVIAIMAVLVGVLAPQFIKYVESSRQSTDMQSVQQMKDAIEAEVADNEDVTSITITISGTNATVAVVPNTVTLDAPMSVDLKSSGWVTATKTSVVYTLDPATGAWSRTTGSDGDNSKSPSKSMDDIFE